MSGRVLCVAMASLALAACASYLSGDYRCESGHTLTIGDASTQMIVTVDEKIMVFKQDSAGRFVNESDHELRIDPEGIKVIEGDQVTVWGCERTSE